MNKNRKNMIIGTGLLFAGMIIGRLSCPIQEIVKDAIAVWKEYPRSAEMTGPRRIFDYTIDSKNNQTILLEEPESCHKRDIFLRIDSTFDNNDEITNAVARTLLELSNELCKYQFEEQIREVRDLYGIK